MTVKCQNALDVKIVEVKVFQWVARRGLSIGEHLAKDAAAVSHQDRGGGSPYAAAYQLFTSFSRENKLAKGWPEEGLNPLK